MPVLCSYTHDIEALSCDEVLIDGSSLLAELGVRPEDLARAIRADIKEKTGCCASVGMGRSRVEKYIITLCALELTDSLLRVQHPVGSVGHAEGQARWVLLPKI